MTVEQYRCFDESSVISYFDADLPKESSETLCEAHEAIDQAIRQGYRWVRSHQQTAIFELQLDHSYYVDKQFAT